MCSPPERYPTLHHGSGTISPMNCKTINFSFLPHHVTAKSPTIIYFRFLYRPLGFPPNTEDIVIVISKYVSSRIHTLTHPILLSPLVTPALTTALAHVAIRPGPALEYPLHYSLIQHITDE